MDSSATPQPPVIIREAVVLNVYDMLWLNDYTSAIGLGVYHSGVEVYGEEYGFGGHQFPYSGIFKIRPRDGATMGPAFQYKQSIDLGETDLTREEVRRVVRNLGKQFRGDKYDLLNHNCNHFSNALAKALCNQPIPHWINRLASVTSRLPLIHKMLPKDWLSPTVTRAHPERTMRNE